MIRDAYVPLLIVLLGAGMLYGDDQTAILPAPPFEIGQRVDNAYKQIPEHLRRRVENAGVQVRVLEKIPDPERQEIMGRFDAEEGAILVARQALGKSNVHPEYVLYHEFGHAFDWAWSVVSGHGKRISSSEGFRRAYSEDRAHIRADDRLELEYFLPAIERTAELARRQRETFAEAVAVYLQTLVDYERPSFVEPFARSFPNVIAFVHDRLSAGEPLTAAESQSQNTDDAEPEAVIARGRRSPEVLPDFASESNSTARPESDTTKTGIQVPYILSVHNRTQTRRDLLKPVSIRKETFTVAVAGSDPETTYQFLIFFDDELIAETEPLCGNSTYVIATERRFPPGRYRLTAQAVCIGSPIVSWLSPAVKVDYQPTYVRNMIRYPLGVGTGDPCPAGKLWENGKNTDLKFE